MVIAALVEAPAPFIACAGGCEDKGNGKETGPVDTVGVCVVDTEKRERERESSK